MMTLYLRYDGLIRSREDFDFFARLNHLGSIEWNGVTGRFRDILLEMEIPEECKKARPRWFEACAEKNADKWRRIAQEALEA